jgi:hypothetical protein
MGRRVKSLALSHADACNPLLQAHPTWAQDNTKADGFPFCLSPSLLSPLRAPSRADPSGLGHAATIYSSVQGPPGVETPTVVIVRSTQLAGQSVVLEPQFRPRLPRVLCDGSRGSEPGQERRPSYGPAESLRTGWFGRGAPILPAVVASPTPGVGASVHPLVEVGSTVAVVVLVAEATRGRRRRVARAPVVDRGFLHESGSRGVMLRGVPLSSGGRAFGPSDRDILQEILELSLDTPPFGGRWFRHRVE